MKPKYSYKTLSRAHSLRRDATDAECRLWSMLRGRQIGNAKFRRQQPIGPFIVDFVCLEHRLIIEADGSQHGESPHDSVHDAYLRHQGIAVLRFWNYDILTNDEGVADMILAEMARIEGGQSLLPLSPTPLPRGERGFQ